jgi:hypothetical protein
MTRDGSRGWWLWGLAALAAASACGGKSARADAGRATAGQGDASTSAGTSGSGATTGSGGSTSASTGGSTATGGAGAADGTGGAGGSGGGGHETAAGTGGESDPGSGDALASTTLVPTAQGWVDHEDVGNDVGVQGFWFAYGDQYGSGPADAPCTKIGLHLPSECAQVTSPPPPPAVGFPNVGGRMHTTGSIERILPCPAGLTTSGCPASDFANMLGAGIGFDLDADSPDSGGARHLWDPARYGVIGIEFTIDAVPLAGLRVEFPILLDDAEGAADFPPLPPGSTTEAHSTGSPYWGAQSRGDGHYPSSPVQLGVNRVLWAEVAPPRLGTYQFDPARMIGVRFHVVSSASSELPYEFTIWDVTYLRK